MAKPKAIELTTPKAPAAGWVTLNKADTKYKPEGVYEVRLAYDNMDDPAVAAFVKAQEDARDKLFDETVERLKSEGKGAAAKQLKKGDILKPELDKESGEETGRYLFKASMKASGQRKDGTPWTQKPKFFDAKGKELKNPPMVSAGSVLKLSVELNPYIMEASKEVAVSLRLKAVQIISLVSRGERSFGSYGFEAEDGDEIEDADNSAPFEPDSSDDDGDDDL